MIVTGCLQCWPYKTIPSQISPDLFLRSCLIGVKFADLSLIPFAQLGLSSPLTPGQGSHSHPIINMAFIKQQQPCPKMGSLDEQLGPFTHQILAFQGGPNHTQFCYFLKSFQSSPADD